MPKSRNMAFGSVLRVLTLGKSALSSGKFLEISNFCKLNFIQGYQIQRRIGDKLNALSRGKADVVSKLKYSLIIIPIS